MPDDKVQYTCQTLEGVVTIGTGCTLDYAVAYPVFPAHAALSAVYAAHAARCRAGILALGPTLRALPHGCLGPHLRIEHTFEVTYAAGGLLSLYFDRYEDLGLFRTGLGRWSEVRRLPEGRLLGLRDLMADPAAARQVIDRTIEAEIASAPPGQYFGTWRRSPRWFFLSERGLCVYYRPGDITARSGGIPTFLIPWDALRPYTKIPL